MVFGLSQFSCFGLQTTLNATELFCCNPRNDVSFGLQTTLNATELFCCNPRNDVSFGLQTTLNATELFVATLAMT